MVATGPMHRDAFFVWDWAGAGKTEVLGPRGDHSDWLTFAAEGKLLVRVLDNRIDVWDWPTRRVRNSADTVGVKVACQAVAPDGKHAAIGGMRNNERDFVIWMCDLTTGRRWTVQRSSVPVPVSVLVPIGRHASPSCSRRSWSIRASVSGPRSPAMTRSRL